MNKRMTCFALAAAVMSTATLADTVDLKDKNNLVSYSIGYVTGKSFMQHKIDINNQAYSQGFIAGLKGAKPAISEADIRLALNNFQKDMMQKNQQQQLQVAQQNQKDGQAFLETNKKKPGVVTLPDGLQYKIITKGTGPSPKSDHVVVVDYEGTLVDGKVFDSSYKRGAPAKFPVNAVIPGWQEALQKMRVGSTWMLYIPAELAYGSNGMPGSIPPNATLIFKVHLISIDDKK